MKQIAINISMSIATNIVVTMFAFIIYGTGSIFMDNSTSLVLMMVTSAIMVSPIVEEYAKGFALRTLEAKYFPIVYGILEFILFTVVFSVSGILRIPPLIMHIGTGVIQHRYIRKGLASKGLWIAIAIHTSFNLIMILGGMAYYYMG